MPSKWKGPTRQELKEQMREKMAKESSDRSERGSACPIVLSSAVYDHGSSSRSFLTIDLGTDSLRFCGHIILEWKNVESDSRNDCWKLVRNHEAEGEETYPYR